MAARELIHFPLRAQLTSRSLFPDLLLLLEHVAESHPYSGCGFRAWSEFRPSHDPCASTNGKAQPTLFTERNVSISRVVSLAWKRN